MSSQLKNPRILLHLPGNVGGMAWDKLRRKKNKLPGFFKVAVNFLCMPVYALQMLGTQQVPLEELKRQDVGPGTDRP